MTVPPGTAGDDRFDPAALDMIHRLGSGALLVRMIDIFLEQSSERITSARAGVQSGDLRAVQLASHSLKSSAAQLGGVGVQRASAAVEKTAAAGTTDSLALGVEQMASEFEQLRDWLQQVKARVSAESAGAAGGAS